MSTVDGLLAAYRRQVALPWERVAAPQRVWFAVYDPSLERRLRPKLGEFELATKEAGHGWRLLDITNSFGEWMAAQEYREAYFEQPEDMEYALEEYREHVVSLVRAALTAEGVDDQTVVALTGVASLFGLTRASAVLQDVRSDIRGRLLIFFPGHRDGNNYRLMDARDGWDYLALAIEADEGS